MKLICYEYVKKTTPGSPPKKIQLVALCLSFDLLSVTSVLKTVIFLMCMSYHPVYLVAQKNVPNFNVIFCNKYASYKLEFLHAYCGPY